MTAKQVTIGRNIEKNRPFQLDANEIIMGRSFLASVTRYGKCVGADTLLALPNGDLITLKEAVAQQERNCYGHIDQQGVIPKSITNWHINREGLSFLRIEPRFGPWIECSIEHHFWAKGDNGEIRYIKAGELKKGDKIAIVPMKGKFGRYNIPEHEIKLLGYLIAEGGLSKGTTFTNAKPEVRREFLEVIQKFEPHLKVHYPSDVAIRISSGKKHGSCRSNLLLDWLSYLRLYPSKSRTKKIPHIILQQNEAGVALFLNRLFAGDGSCSLKTKRRKGVAIEYCTTSPYLAVQVSILLMRFGIYPLVYRCKTKTGPYWRILITRAAHVKLFLTKIGIFSKDPDEALRRISDTITNDELDEEGDILWAPIRRITTIPSPETAYDLTTNSSNYVANGLVVHNSWTNRRLIEQLFGQAGIIIIDPEGEYASLREKFPFMIIGKDIPIQIETAEYLAETVLKEDLSVIIDLSMTNEDISKEYVASFVNHFMFLETKLRKPYLIVLEEADEFCLTADTEVLTREGWKHYTELKKGEHIVCFSLKTGHGSFQPLQEIFVRDWKEDLINHRSKTADFLLTPEHRVVYSVWKRSKKPYEETLWAFKEAAQLPKSFKIPCAFSDWLPLVAHRYDLHPDFIELAAWLITEGHTQHIIHKGKKYEYLCFYQSTVNKENIESIHALGKRLPFTLSESKRKREGTESIEFHLGAVGSKIMKALLSNGIHRIPRDWLNSLNKAQLLHLYHCLMQGDGTKQTYKTRITKQPRERDACFYPGANQGLANDFQELCIKIGFRAVIGGSKRNLRIYISTNDFHSFKDWQRNGTTKYEGKVWDIRVPTGAFVARRKGKPFITGNCPEKGVAKATSLKAMKNVAKKGGKRGVGLIVTTHRPAYVSKNVISQCTTLKMIGRVEWSSDLDVLQDFLRVNPEILRMPRKNGKAVDDGKPHVESLSAGTFFIAGSAAPEDAFVKVGPVETKHLGATPDLIPPTPKELQEVVARLAAEMPKVIERIKQPVASIEEIKKTAEAKAKADFEKKLQREKKRIDAQSHQKITGLETELTKVRETLEEVSRKAALQGDFLPIHDVLEHPIVKARMADLPQRAKDLLIKIEREPDLTREHLAAFMSTSKDAVKSIADKINRVFNARVIVASGRPLKHRSMLKRLFLTDVAKKEMEELEKLQKQVTKLQHDKETLIETTRALQSEMESFRIQLKNAPNRDEMSKLERTNAVLTTDVRDLTLRLKKSEKTVTRYAKIIANVEAAIKTTADIEPVVVVAEEKEIDVPQPLSSPQAKFPHEAELSEFLHKFPSASFTEAELAVALNCDATVICRTLKSLCTPQGPIEQIDEGFRWKKNGNRQ